MVIYWYLTSIIPFKKIPHLCSRITVKKNQIHGYDVRLSFTQAVKSRVRGSEAQALERDQYGYIVIMYLILEIRHHYFQSCEKQNAWLKNHLPKLGNSLEQRFRPFGVPNMSKSLTCI